MSEKSLCEYTITDISPLIKRKDISPVELTTSILDRIHETDHEYNAYISVIRDEAIKLSKQAEKDIMNNDYKGELHGIPLAVKDNIDLVGIPTTNGSKSHENNLPEKNAKVIDKLLGAGMIPVGKTNMHEFAYGITNDNPYYGPARNPWNTDKISGGSSGGSAVALAAHSTIAAIGTDTAGSIRIPSACCGTVGLKPTHGTVSTKGVFPLAWSLDHVGPMTKSVSDALLMFREMSSHGASLSLSKFQGEADLTGVTIAIPKGIDFPIDKDLENLIDDTVQTLKKLNAKIKYIEIETFKHVGTASMATFSVEGSTVHHKQLIEAPEQYSPDVRNYLKFGEAVTGIQYLQGQQLRRIIIEELKRIYTKTDAILFPTIPISAPEIGKQVVQINDDKLDIVDALEYFNALANVSGFPSLSLPIGMDKMGLPLGIQFMGDAYKEGKLLKIGCLLERVSNVK